MLNAENIQTVYSKQKKIKETTKSSKRWCQKHSIPREATLHAVMRVIRSYGKANRQKILIHSEIGHSATDRAIAYLLEKEKITREFVKNAGKSKVYDYSIRGDINA